MNTETVRIGNRLIGPGQPCFIVVEVGTTCLGDINNALQLVDAGALAGVDAMKFQVIDPEQLSDSKVEYKFSSGGQTYTANMKEMFTKLQYSREQWLQIRDACHLKGMEFFATVDYLGGVDLLESLNVVAHKIGAWDVTFYPLVEKIGATGKPLFVDLGPATEQVLDKLVERFKAAGGKTVLFMHDYHTHDPVQMNMRTVSYLNQKFCWPAGYSSPGQDHDLDFLALGLGAYYLEKRLILSRSLKAFHADESLEPDELKMWVASIRRAEKALGRTGILPSETDLKFSEDYYRSVCTSRPVAKGEIFSEDNLTCKRPGTGIQTDHLADIMGNAASRDLAENVLLKYGDWL